MKPLILLICLVSCSYISYSQCEFNVSTDPQNPQNDSLPTPQFLNSFDWNPSNLLGTQLTNMQYNQLMLHVMNPQQPQYYNYIYSGELPTPENGWELLLLNTGTYPNLDDLPNGTLPDVPYIALYNRYSGMLRIFANYGDGYLPSGISFDAVKVILTFEDLEKVNGNLRILNGIDQALDKPTKVLESVSLAKHPNSPGKWFVADFQITYDPCVCYFPSRMRLRFEFIESESLELHGREISVEQDLIDGTTVESKDYLSNFDYTGNTASGGVAIYRTLEQMIDDYEAKLLRYKDSLAIVNEHNALVERRLAVVNLFKQVIINGGNSTIDAISNMPWFNNAITYANDLIGDTVVKKKEIVKEAKKAFGKEFNTFISKNFKKKPKPSNPLKPVATFSEMHFSGQLEERTEVDGPNFYTPGTYGSPGTVPLQSITGEELAYPIYNEKLGSFALLKSPKLKMSRATSDLVNKLTADWIQDDPTNWDSQWRLYSQRYTKSSRNYQIQLAEDLVYSFNPALDIKSTEVRAAFVIKAKTYKNFPVSGGLHNAWLNRDRTTNVISTNRDVEHYYSYVKKHETNLLNGTNFPQYSIDYSMPLTVDFDSVMFETSFFPIDAFYNNTYAIGLWKEYLSDVTITSPNPNYYPDECEYYPQMNGDGTWCYPTPAQVDHAYPPTISSAVGGYLFDFEIHLKLMVDIEFETVRSDGEPNSFTQTFTYKISDSDIEWLIGIDLTTNLEGTSLDINQYPENIALRDIDFNGNHIDGCEKYGNHYTCRAWNDISIDGELTTSSGHTVEIIAGNEIVELPESEISPEIIRRIEPVLDYSHPMPEAIEDSVIAFCGTTGQASDYAAGKPEKSILSNHSNHNASSESENTHIDSSWDFQLFPNPTSKSSYIRMNNTDDKPVKVTVTDVLGKKVNVVITEVQTNMYSLNLANYQKGIYFITVSSFGGSKTKQLIIH